MTVASIRLPTTITVIVLLALFCIIPLILYMRIILKFLLDRPLQKELVGSGPNTNSESARGLDEEEIKKVPTPPRVLLSFNKVTYTVKSSQKQILKGVTGYFAPGTLTAILGTSGCGKTTLLTVLADQMESTGETTGDVFVNGKPRSSSFRRLCAYVMQSDNLLESLTVREALWFTAELRLGKFTAKEKMAIVRKVLRDLDLFVAADRRISVLSGGQKRRVTVATELVAMPSLIFLDEPTSGLDASGSLKLVRVLRKLADAGRTIVCTIHQPRVDAFNLFHMVLLMNSGSLLYFGPMTRIVEYFTSVGQRHALENKRSHGSVRNLLKQHQSVRNLLKQQHKQQPSESGIKADNEENQVEEINPADFVLDFTHGSASQVQVYCDDFAQSDQFNHICQVVDLIHSGTLKAGDFFGHQSIRNDPAWFPELHSFPSDHVDSISHNKSFEGEDVEFKNDSCGGDATCECCCRPYGLVTKYASTNLKQIFTLVRRAFVSSMRNGAYLMSWVLGIVMMLFMGMLYCYVRSPPYSPEQIEQIEQNMVNWGACSQDFNSLGTILGGMNESEVNSTLLECGETLNESVYLALARTSLLYQLLASMFFSEMPLLASIHHERNLYVREHASRSYSSMAWTLSWICRIAFTGLVKGAFFPPFVYFSAQLNIAFEPYILFSIFMGIMSVMGASVALLVTVTFESFETASVAFVVINIISQNLCGYFITEQYIPWWFRWIYYINFFRYTFQGTLISQRLTPQGLEAAEKVGTLAKFQETQEVAWFFALIAVIFCVGVQLIALGIVQFTGSSASERFSSCRCRGLRSDRQMAAVSAPTKKLQFNPVQLGGAFTLNTYVRNEVQDTVESTAPAESQPESDSAELPAADSDEAPVDDPVMSTTTPVATDIHLEARSSTKLVAE